MHLCFAKMSYQRLSGWSVKLWRCGWCVMSLTLVPLLTLTHEDGLIHFPYERKFIKHPSQVVSAGDLRQSGLRKLILNVKSICRPASNETDWLRWAGSSLEDFGRPLSIKLSGIGVHVRQVGFSPKDGHLDFNPKVYQELGLNVFRKLSDMNLCHYHLYFQGKGLSTQGSRF